MPISICIAAIIPYCISHKKCAIISCCARRQVQRGAAQCTVRSGQPANSLLFRARTHTYTHTLGHTDRHTHLPHVALKSRNQKCQQRVRCTQVDTKQTSPPGRCQCCLIMPTPGQVLSASPQPLQRPLTLTLLQLPMHVCLTLSLSLVNFYLFDGD